MKILHLVLLLGLGIAVSITACNSGSDNKKGVQFNPTTNAESSTKLSDAEREQKIAAKKKKFNAVQSDNLIENLAQFVGKVKLTVMLPNDQGLNKEENRILESKMLQIVTSNGIGGLGGNPRFIITPVISILKKDVTSTAPIKYSIKYDITFYVVDMITGNVFGTYNTQLLGVDDSENRALLAVFNNIKTNDVKIQSFLKSSQNKIIDYYKNNGDKIIAEANTLNAKEKYSQAMSLLESIPSEATIVFEKAQPHIKTIFQNYLDNQCETSLAMMKAELGNYNELSAAGFNPKAMGYYKMIPANAKCKKEADKLYSDYKENLNPQKIKDWENAEKGWNQKIAQQNSDNEYRRLQEEMKAKIAIEGQTCLMDKYKKDAAYDNLPWLRTLIYVGDNDPFDGYEPDSDCK
ncbi:MAG: hypothetical protein DRI86_13915 [Bacteroidetes bacterium]|nr:MAG: hypothetical protein DRI86_13915 [Bacteroidota bacterium]